MTRILSFKALARYLARYMARYLARHLARYLARYRDRYLPGSWLHFLIWEYHTQEPR